MNPIKPTQANALLQAAAAKPTKRTPSATGEKGRAASAGTESPMHALYESVRSSSEAERSTRVAQLKDQVMNGSYQPNMSVVAERLMTDLGWASPA